MQILRSKDFLAGLMFVAFGIATLTIAASYPMGTTAKMGPGYFPKLLGMLLIALGGVMTIGSIRLGSGSVQLGSPKPIAIVVFAVALFGYGVDQMGLLLAAFLLVAISSFAGAIRPVEAAASAAVLALASVGGFIYGLGLPLVSLPSWFGSH